MKVIKPRANRPSPMSNSLFLQDKMDDLIEQHLPPLWKTRRRNLALFTAGLYRAGHVHLSAVADQIPGSAKQSSKTRRLRRFLANEEVDPSRWQKPVAKQLLRRAAESGPSGLLVDTLELTGDRRLLSPPWPIGAGLSRSGGTWTEKTGSREEKSRRRSSRN